MATQAETIDVRSRKNEESLSISNDRENSLIGWYTVNNTDSPEIRLIKEKIPSRMDETIINDKEVVRINFRSKDAVIRGNIVPARRTKIAIIKSIRIIRCSS